MKSLKAKGGREIYSMLTTWQLPLSVLQPIGAPSQQASELFRDPRRSLLRRLRQRFIADFGSVHSASYGMSWSGAVCCARTVTHGS